MSKGKGRPARTGERLVGIHLRVSPAHRAELQRLADQRGMQFSELCRQLLRTNGIDAKQQHQAPNA